MHHIEFEKEFLKLYKWLKYYDLVMQTYFEIYYYIIIAYISF